jgi:hypothetical protein
MKKTIASIREELHHKFSEPLVEEIADYVQRNNRALMGGKQWRSFRKDMAYIALYKDMAHKSYQDLETEIEYPEKIGHNSLNANVHRIREILFPWADSQIRLGSAWEWNVAARHANLTVDLVSVNLWMDSTDIPIEHNKGRGESSEHWSGKIGHPAHRYVTIADGKGKIIQLWTGVSPKVYDSAFLESNRKWMMDNLKGGHIIADNHFLSGGKTFKDPKFICNARESKKRAREDVFGDRVPLEPSTKKISKTNAAIKKSRACVERNYADIFNRMETFNFPWNEDLEQLDFLMFYAVAIHNRLVK